MYFFSGKGQTWIRIQIRIRNFLQRRNISWILNLIRHTGDHGVEKLCWPAGLGAVVVNTHVAAEGLAQVDVPVTKQKIRTLFFMMVLHLFSTIPDSNLSEFESTII